ncbi:hypothetical protein [Burkholderia gladioli]|uniref:hypothetical protein n=1 Tax=Burkholderia gladioli TaxID=28095 RepID=UPI0015E6CFC0|nr:hypothetical protein [Burkholderia gladioli]MBA1364032.1 hypothetical protein [Burkholderia gladioli]
MIKDKEIAKDFHNTMLDVSRDINVALYRAWPHLTNEEKDECRLAVANILGEIHDRVLQPLYVDHPTLRPSELDGPKCLACGD